MPRTHIYSATVIYGLLAGGLMLLYLLATPAYVRFTYEDRVGEWLQTWLFVAVLVLAISLARRQRAYRWSGLLLAAASFYTVMEEISWGQRLIGFDSPAFFVENNVQGETNLHNLLTGPVNTGLKEVIEYGLAAALLAYGLMYPLLLSRGFALAAWCNRLGALPAPLYLWPFFVTAALFEVGWFKINEAEIAELLVGATLMLTLLHYRYLGAPYPPDAEPASAPCVSARSTGRCAGVYIGAFAGLTALAWLTTFAFLALPGRADDADARLANGYEKFAERLEKQGDYQKAAGLYLAGFELGPTHLFMVHEALRNLEKAGDTAAYDYWYRAMLDATATKVIADGADIEQLLMLVQEYKGIGATAEAARYDEQAFAAAVTRVSMDVEDGEGYYWLGRVYQERGELEKARSAFQQALAIEPRRDKYRLALRRLP